MGSKATLQSDTLEMGINELEFFLNMSGSSSLEVLGRESSKWERLFYSEHLEHWTWVRLELPADILQLRFHGELYSPNAYISIDEVEARTLPALERSWQIFAFSVVGSCIVALFGLECRRTCGRSQRRHEAIATGTAFSGEFDTLPSQSCAVPLGIELPLVRGTLEESKRSTAKSMAL
jgi:hypothetical protein